MNVDDKTYQRFMSKVSKDPCGCWHWNGTKNHGKYGTFSFNRKPVGAHRFSYLIHKGEIPNGLYVCHSCDTRNCVNPEHLWLGTPQDNMDDMVRKQRKKGQNSKLAKLTNEDIHYIRNWKYPLSWLLDKYDVTLSTLSNIANRKTWTHI